MKLSKEQQIQENEYKFPYHHIANGKDELVFSVSDTWMLNYISTLNFLIEHLSKYEMKSLVDIGCGDGKITDIIAAEFPDTSVLGMDYSAAAIAHAKAFQVSNNRRNLEYKNEGLDAYKEKFDIAILIEVLEHIPPEDIPNFLDSIRKSLKSNGFLIITVPHKNKPLEDKHFQHFTFHELIQCISPYFSVHEFHGFETNNKLWWFLIRLIANRHYEIKNKYVLNFIFKFYMKFMFRQDSEKSCQRIFLVAQKI